jgi:MFS transporter, ACS family, hexuronate transporter
MQDTKASNTQGPTAVSGASSAKGSVWHGRVRWGVCALLFAAVVLSYVDRLVLGVLKPELALRYSWTNSGYGDITGYFQICYGLGFLGFGWLIDKLGARIGYLLAMGIWTFGHFLQMLPTSTTGCWHVYRWR